MKERGDSKPGLQPYLLLSAYWVVECLLCLCLVTSCTAFGIYFMSFMAMQA